MVRGCAEVVYVGVYAPGHFHPPKDPSLLCTLDRWDFLPQASIPRRIPALSSGCSGRREGVARRLTGGDWGGGVGGVDARGVGGMGGWGEREDVCVRGRERVC